MTPKRPGIAKAKTTKKKASTGTKSKKLGTRKKKVGRSTVPRDAVPLAPTLEAHLVAYSRALQEKLDEMSAEVAALRADLDALRGRHEEHRHRYSLDLWEGGAAWITLDTIRRWIEGDSLEEIFGHDESEKVLLENFKEYGWYFSGKPASGTYEPVTAPPS
jgi:hypothetical protein